MKRFSLLGVLLLLVVAACDVDTGDVVSSDDDTAVAEPTESPDEDDTPAVEPTPTLEAVNDDDSDTDDVPATEPDPTPVPEPTETPVPEPSHAAIGETIVFGVGIGVTVYEIERPLEDTGFWEPDPGYEFLALNVEVCAGPNVPADQTSSANPHDFELIMSDNTRIGPTVGVRDPSLNHTDLLADDCVRGWVTFEVPADDTFKEIRYQSYDWDFNRLIGRWE